LTLNDQDEAVERRTKRKTEKYALIEEISDLEKELH
jgi:hypothetical protein